MLEGHSAFTMRAIELGKRQGRLFAFRVYSFGTNCSCRSHVSELMRMIVSVQDGLADKKLCG
jgi:hypothetical protein